ncbi:hypothetical protein SAMN06265348_12117 [Pedobacter westerhofensis]|uniref:Uncharacterized protein n=1 Tax=Pedobacter westerhofensis TaxID=425512 RepID=A0A521FSZ1_9SPHI|nr:hypothetical protein [Pedobacter westerhofensis]SMO99246.1 hypothetical protein SAMN06265348_12117 [Pedobacter westerhofensis]
MLPSFQSNSGTENSELSNKVMGALEPAIKQHWPKIEPYADKALAAAQDDDTIEALGRKIYPFLPMVLRLAIKEDKFITFILEHKGPLLTKLTEIKNKQND